jgi:hypothetical protein
MEIRPTDAKSRLPGQETSQPGQLLLSLPWCLQHLQQPVIFCEAPASGKKFLIDTDWFIVLYPASPIFRKAVWSSAEGGQ